MLLNYLCNRSVYRTDPNFSSEQQKYLNKVSNLRLTQRIRPSKTKAIYKPSNLLKAYERCQTSPDKLQAKLLNFDSYPA